MTDANKPDAPAGPSKELVQAVVIMLLSVLAIGAVVFAMQQSVARDAAVADAKRLNEELRSLQLKVIAGNLKIGQLKLALEKARMSGVGSRVPPRAVPPAGRPFRSLYPPIAPGAMLGSPLIPPTIAARRSVPKPVAIRPRGVVSLPFASKGSLRIQVVKYRLRNKGTRPRISVSMWRNAARWPEAVRKRVVSIHFDGIELPMSSLKLLKGFVNLLRLKFEDLTISSGRFSPSSGHISSSWLPGSIATLVLKNVTGGIGGLCDAKLPRLKRLSIDSVGEFRDRDMRCLASSQMPALSSLSLVSLRRLSDRGVALLVRAHGLRALTLSDCKQVNGMGLSGLKSHGGMERLVLTLLPKLEDRMLRYLASLASLRTLQLSGSGINGSGLHHLAGLVRLTTLQLSDTNLSDTGAASLARLVGVRSLLVERTPLTDVGLASLAKIKGLRKLSLKATKIGSGAALSLGSFVGLHELNLADTKVGDRAAIMLQRCVRLRKLNLYRTRVTDKIAPALANLQQLQRLDLGKTMITSKGARFLATNARRLRWLRVSAMMLPAALQKMRREFPRLRLLDQ